MSVGILRTFADPDLWGHVRFGLDILASRRLPSVDPYSFTSDLSWTNHEWLSESLMAVAYHTAGNIGLLLLKAALLLCSYAIVWSAVHRRKAAWRWGAMAVAAAGALPIAYTVRPQLWTLSFLVALCRLTIADSVIAKWLMPLLFAVWCNMHGGWVVGLGVLALWAAGAIVTSGLRVRLEHITVLFLCALATLCSPYGWHLWGFLASTLSVQRPEISEWQPIWRDTVSSVALWISGVAFSALVVQRSSPPPLRTAAPLAGLIVLSALANRVVPLFVPAAVVLLAPLLPALEPQNEAVPRARTLFDAVATGVATSLAVFPVLDPSCIRMSGGWMPDQGPVWSLSRPMVGVRKSPI